jgi:hypothetical protein
MPPRAAYTSAGRAHATRDSLAGLAIHTRRNPFVVHWRRWWWLYNLIVLPLAFVLAMIAGIVFGFVTP